MPVNSRGSGSGRRDDPSRVGAADTTQSVRETSECQQAQLPASTGLESVLTKKPNRLHQPAPTRTIAT